MKIVAAVFANNAISLIIKPYLWFALSGMLSTENIAVLGEDEIVRVSCA
jgi:hypothetical protein